MTSRALPAVALVLALVSSGCVSLEMGRIKRQIEQDVEASGTAEVGRGFAMAFGRGTIGTSRFLGRMFAPTATEPYRALTRHVRQVKVARYGVSGHYDARALSRPEALRRYEDDGWYPLVTVREPEETVWVLYREDDREPRVTDLLTVVLGQEDLVLTRVRGDLSAAVLKLLEIGRSDSGFIDGPFLDSDWIRGPAEPEPPADDAPDLGGSDADARP